MHSLIMPQHNSTHICLLRRARCFACFTQYLVTSEVPRLHVSCFRALHLKYIVHSLSLLLWFTMFEEHTFDGCLIYGRLLFVGGHSMKYSGRMLVMYLHTHLLLTMLACTVVAGASLQLLRVLKSDSCWKVFTCYLNAFLKAFSWSFNESGALAFL